MHFIVFSFYLHLFLVFGPLFFDFQFIYLRTPLTSSNSFLLLKTFDFSFSLECLCLKAMKSRGVLRWGGRAMSHGFDVLICAVTCGCLVGGFQHWCPVHCFIFYHTASLISYLIFILSQISFVQQTFMDATFMQGHWVDKDIDSFCKRIVVFLLWVHFFHFILNLFIVRQNFPVPFSYSPAKLLRF
jgi:hypothetical protein